MIQSTATEILTAYLVSQGIVGRPADDPAWPMTKGQLPIEGVKGNKDKWVAGFDLTALTEGKIQRTGETVTKPKVQILVRSAQYDEADFQARLIAFILSPVKRAIVVCSNGERVLFEACKILQPPSFLYQEEKNRRQVFAQVVQLTISKEFLFMNYAFTTPGIHNISEANVPMDQDLYFQVNAAGGNGATGTGGQAGGGGGGGGGCSGIVPAALRTPGDTLTIGTHGTITKVTIGGVDVLTAHPGSDSIGSNGGSGGSASLGAGIVQGFAAISGLAGGNGLLNDYGGAGGFSPDGGRGGPRGDITVPNGSIGGFLGGGGGGGYDSVGIGGLGAGAGISLTSPPPNVLEAEVNPFLNYNFSDFAFTPAFTVVLYVQSPGGGGGSGSVPNVGGGGGGGGAYAEIVLTKALWDAGGTIHIGQRGSGGESTGSPGISATDTIITLADGRVITVGGGKCPTLVADNIGAAGGLVSGTGIALCRVADSGLPGSDGTSTTGGQGGAGGGPSAGQGGSGATSSLNGERGFQFGGGGGGSYPSSPVLKWGGDGAVAQVLIKWE